MASTSSEQTTRFTLTPFQQVRTQSTVRRACVACAFCRARKVRCDRQNDQSCTNCVFENVQCVLMPRQRRNGRAKSVAKSLQAGASGGHAAPPSTKTISLDQSQSRSQQGSSPVQESPRQQHSPGTASGGLGSADSGTHLMQDVDSDINWREAALESVPPPRPINPSISPSFRGSCPDSGIGLHSSEAPSFLTPAPSYLSEDDIDYLHRKGALCIPDQELRDALIESYVHFIHPCYPIIDLDLLEDTLLGNSDERFSFAVFQAIMFAGSAWVDIKLLRKLGFLTRWSARKSFYLKARLLYDLDYERDRLCQIQALILLSLWWKGPNTSKDGWHWLGLALSLSRTIGLHHDANNQHLDAKSRGLRRRLWWSCVIRDTFTSISQNRVPRISDADFVVPPLTLDDFQWHKQREADCRGIGVQCLKVQQQLANICIQTAAICRIITKVLLAAYHESATACIDTLYFNSAPRHGRSYLEPTKIRDIEEDFRAWTKNLSPDISHASPTPSPSLRHEQAPFVHRALLSILYHTGLIMIHRQRDLHQEGMAMSEVATPSSQETPRAIVREAALQVNKIIMDMYAVDLMKDIPATVISCLFPVSISHILDMRSKDPSLRGQGRQRLEECKQALRELADGHLSAEWAVNFLNYVEAKGNAHANTTKGSSTLANTQHVLVGGRENTYTPVQRRQDPDRSQDSGLSGGHLAQMARADSTHPSLPTNSMAAAYATTDNSASSITSPNMWFGFPDAQWDIPGMGWLQDDSMAVDFGWTGFREG